MLDQNRSPRLRHQEGMQPAATRNGSARIHGRHRRPLRRVGESRSSSRKPALLNRQSWDSRSARRRRLSQHRRVLRTGTGTRTRPELSREVDQKRGAAQKHRNLGGPTGSWRTGTSPQTPKPARRDQPPSLTQASETFQIVDDRSTKNDVPITGRYDDHRRAQMPPATGYWLGAKVIDANGDVSTKNLSSILVWGVFLEMVKRETSVNVQGEPPVSRA